MQLARSFFGAMKERKFCIYSLSRYPPLFASFRGHLPFILRSQFTHPQNSAEHLPAISMPTPAQAQDAPVSPEDKLASVQLQAEEIFFDPSRLLGEESKVIQQWANELLSCRLTYSSRDVRQPIRFTGAPPRHFMIAQRALLMAALEGNYAYRNSCGGLALWLPDFSYSADKKKQFPYRCSAESVQIGQTIYMYHTSAWPYRNHLGDFHTPQLGTYARILRDLNKMTGGELSKERMLVGLLKNFCQNCEAVSESAVEDFANPFSVSSKVAASKAKADFLNRVFFHVVVMEPCRRMLPLDEEHRRLPLISSHARALRLLIDGHLAIDQVFGQDSDFGIYTGQGISYQIKQGRIKQKIAAINELYSKLTVDSLSIGKPLNASSPGQTESDELTVKCQIDELKYIYGE